MGKSGRVCCDFFNVTYLNELISYKLQIYVKVMLIILSITCKKIVRLIKHLMCQNIKRVGSIFSKFNSMNGMFLLH